ncbi:hypothetical protein BS17DRAFT_795657 [Gyrodon lividus]|nr:hypothetical protein BS17DRAFT_795657 [Gyrodon lividus]
MACVDALFRTYLQPKEGRDDKNSLYQHIGLLCPDETGKMTSKPGFRRMHEVVHHDLWASVLDCWRLEAQHQDRMLTTLELFTKAKPSWEQITQMSRAIICKYVASSEGLDKAQGKSAAERDKRFENQSLQNQDELLYVDLCHTMNAGDVGRVEASFLPWFLISMNFNYLSKLRNVIRRNLLCNPTGKANEFHAIDWLVIFSGMGPNRTIEHIIKELPLIEVYRHCHVTVENAFHLQNHTLHHISPDMTKMIQRLAAKIKEKGAHTFRHGRSALCSVPDQVIQGISMLQTQKEVIVEGNDVSTNEIEGEDLAV